jgi:hypothetical protein
MNIRKWTRPGTDEVRYYFDLKFGGARFLSFDANRLLSGRWIGRSDDGMAHIYAKTQAGSGYCRTEDGEWLDAKFGIEGKTFEEWEAMFAACQTGGGNFSEARYMKLDA